MASSKQAGMITDNKIEIVDFNPAMAAYFKALNIAWLREYFIVEPIDEEMLSNPQSFIIDKGGYIFFAKRKAEIAGTFALIKAADGVFELSKMAVSKEQRGMHIGNQMLEFCLQKAKELGMNKLILYSSTKLENAIHLYRKYGFIEVPLDNSEYKRSDIKMEIIL